MRNSIAETRTPPDFTDWRYLWPPRPTSAVLPQSFPYLANQGYEVQFKLNGACAVIGLGPNDRVELWNRHEEPLQWNAPAEVIRTLRQMFPDRDTWTVLVAELLHSKVKQDNGGVRDTLYLHDILVHAGHSLVGMPYAFRHRLIMGAAVWVGETERHLTPGADFNFAALMLTPRVWIACNYSGRMAGDLYRSIDPKGIAEGIVLKDMSAALEPCVQESSNSDWSAKCRYATKNLAF